MCCRLNTVRFALAATAAVSIATAAGAQNLVTNGGFESGTFSAWTLVNAPGGTLVGVNNGAHSGTFGAYFGAVANQHDSIRQTGATIAGRKYEIEFWTKNSAAGGDSLRVYWEGQPVMDQTPATVPTDGNWYKVVAIVTTTLNGSQLRLDAYDAPAAIYVDDVGVYQVITPGYCDGDSDGNRAVNFADIINTLANYGATCP